MDEYQSASLDELFIAVANPTRRGILARLAVADARVTELSGEFPISLNSTSKHIRMLERAGLVHRTVSGRDHFLSLRADRLAQAAEWMDHYRQFWGDRLAALQSFAVTKRVGLDRKRE